jgi:hypothetical protein
MVITWWSLWIVFLVVFLLSPVSYGWAYRGWGPPYPRYIQRRRGARAAADSGSAPFDHHAWGWGGDFIWMVLFIWIFWFIAANWWR